MSNEKRRNLIVGKESSIGQRKGNMDGRVECGG